MALAIVGVMMAGCVRAELVPCGDQLCPNDSVCFVEPACPSGSVCPDECVAIAQLDACAGRLDTEPCSGPGIAEGHCDDGVCRPSICGDSRVDFGEVCDDGNTTGLDGCSANCRSGEICGDGIVDIALSEQCDDGIVGQSADGCTSRCEIELPSWIDATPSPLAARMASAMAFDSTRGVVVLFGGRGPAGENLGDTWEWDGITWRQRFPVLMPSPRVNHAMAYDPMRRVHEWAAERMEWVVVTTLRYPTMAGYVRATSFDSIRRRIAIFGRENPLEEVVFSFGFDSAKPAERCATGYDDDGDGLTGCADPDCIGRCDPMCAIGAICDGERPRCGDGACSPVEDYLVCPDDCEIP